MVRYRKASKKIRNRHEDFDPDEMIIMIPKWKIKEIEDQGMTIDQYLSRFNIACTKCGSMRIVKIR